MLKTIIRSCITFSFILIFFYTGISKFTDYSEFTSEIHNSPLLKTIPSWIIWIIPVIELIVTIMLIKRQWRLRGLYLCSLLMILFTLYVVILNGFAYYVPCSCGGFLNFLPQNIHIPLNIILVVWSLLGIYLERNAITSLRSYKYIMRDTQDAQDK